MTREDILEKLREILCTVLKRDRNEANAYTEASLLTTDLGLDSIGMLYTVISIEELFGVRFDDVGFSDFTSVKDVVDYIERKLP